MLKNMFIDNLDNNSSQHLNVLEILLDRLLTNLLWNWPSVSTLGLPSAGLPNVYRQSASGIERRSCWARNAWHRHLANITTSKWEWLPVCGSEWDADVMNLIKSYAVKVELLINPTVILCSGDRTSLESHPTRILQVPQWSWLPVRLPQCVGDGALHSTICYWFYCLSVMLSLGRGEKESVQCIPCGL